MALPTMNLPLRWRLQGDGGFHLLGELNRIVLWNINKTGVPWYAGGSEEPLSGMDSLRSCKDNLVNIKGLKYLVIQKVFQENDQNFVSPCTPQNVVANRDAVSSRTKPGPEKTASVNQSLRTLTSVEVSSLKVDK